MNQDHHRERQKRSRPADQLIMKTIPRTGEKVPAIGLGTYSVFDVGPQEAERGPLREVLRLFVMTGGSLVDSSPMYGQSESVVGMLSEELGLQKRLFLATKVWTTGREAGIRQMSASFRLMRTNRIDLMQVHNLADWEVHFRTIREWKEQGKVRYSGITHYTAGAYSAVERVMRKERPDFVQINYSPASREADERILPLAQDLGIAVIANRPLDTGRLFTMVRSRALPAWANELGCTNWSQFFLKFVISHPAITCAIPATSNPEHLRDNMRACVGSLPNAAERERMASYVERR